MEDNPFVMHKNRRRGMLSDVDHADVFGAHRLGADQGDGRGRKSAQEAASGHDGAPQRTPGRHPLPKRPLKPGEKVPATTIESVDWATRIDDGIAVGLTAGGRSLAFVFKAADADRLVEGVIAALPPSPSENPGVARRPPDLERLEVQEWSVVEIDRAGKTIELRLEAGGEGVQVRMTVEEAIQIHRRMLVHIRRQIQRTAN